jgi:hypothetical protein
VLLELFSLQVPVDPVFVSDVNGDGYADIITGAGMGSFPEVKVFSGRDGSPLMDFFAYNSALPGGVFVAAGDVNGDGITDITIGSGAGTSPLVNVFLGPGGALYRSFSPFYGSFINGVHVGAIRDLTADRGADIAVSGGGTQGSGLISQDPGQAGSVGAVPTQVLDGMTLNLLDSFFAFPGYFGGVNVGGSQ